MKKILLLCLTFLLVSTVSSIEFNVNPTYPQGGAIITTISGSFQKSLSLEDFTFYRNHVRVPMNFDLRKIGDEYYLYVDLESKDANNYSIQIADVEYLKGSKVIKEDIQRNFTVTNTVADFTISEGFIMTEDDFSLTVQNLQDEKSTIGYKLGEQVGSRTLYSGEITRFDFSVNSLPQLKIQYLEIKSNSTTYQIPIYILESPKNIQPVKFEFDKHQMNISLDLDNETRRTVYLSNTGTETIFQIKLSLDSELEKYVKLSKEEIFNLSSGFLYPIEISVFSDDLPRKIHGNLTARSSSFTDSIFLNITFSPGYQPSAEETSNQKTCVEIGGYPCSNADLCKGEIFTAKDGNCCQTSCLLDDSASSGSFKILGWIVLAVLIGVGVWFYFKKYRNAESAPKGVFKFLQKKE